MASVGQAIYNHLKASSDVTNIISTKIYPSVLPQGGSLPACTYSQISGVRIHAMGQDPGLTHPRYQISSWSTSYSQVHSLAEKVRQSLQDYSGTTGGGVNIQRIFFDQETELPEVDQDSRLVTYQIAQEYIIWYSTE